jgi:NAD(P)-dependent dehydrogenase (short-subunit alcohol dehydrogenase family)
MDTKPLHGKIALVAGATRGAGRGIACMLGAAGATVYCTGRSSRLHPQVRPADAGPFTTTGRPETIEETAELVTAWGGTGIALRVDHTNPSDILTLAQRIQSDHGRLDLLVNDIWGGDAMIAWGTPFWELDPQAWVQLQQQTIYSHILTSRHLAPLLIAQQRGLIIEITDGDQQDHYRGQLYYDLLKALVIRLAFAMAQELRPHGVAALALTPGFLRSEAMLEYMGVTEANWRDGAAKDPHFIASETPFFVGRAVAALAADPQIMVKSGGVYSSWALADQYGFSDINGEQPHWGRYREAQGL